MIEAKALSKRYGDTYALRDASFSVHRGEVLGFLGPNGAGKTTTMKILTCFIAPSAGTAIVNGADIFEDSLSVRRSIGYLPESTPLYTEMLVHEYLAFMAEMRSIPAADIPARIKKVVQATSLSDVLHKGIRTLSKGYRQRVGLAQALIHEPPILILDEPMSGLDPNQAAEIRDLIRELGRERTVILSTHNLAEVQVTCGRVLIVAKGKLVADDTPQSLQARAGKPRYAVTVQGPESARDPEAAGAELRSVLEAVAGVAAVRTRITTAAELQVQVEAAGRDDLRPAISKAVSGAGFVVLGLSSEGEKLEDVFRNLTLGQEGPAAAPAATAAPASTSETEQESTQAQTGS
ncbi:MAG: ABC transporter ATP-binding protein [Polyangiales bacterium]